MNRDELKALIGANKQMLSLLDKQLFDLQHLVRSPAEEAADEEAAAKQHPFFYGAIGDDGKAGIMMVNDDPSTPATDITRPTKLRGIVRIHEDAPFVWTAIAATVSINIGTNRQARFRSFFDTSSNMGGFRLGFTDESSGRALFQAELGTDNSVSGGDQLLAPAFFDTNRLMAAQTSCGPGHGPSSHFQLPSEMLLPASGVVSVDVIPPAIISPAGVEEYPDAWRLHVALIGYKILGD